MASAVTTACSLTSEGTSSGKDVLGVTNGRFWFLDEFKVKLLSFGLQLDCRECQSDIDQLGQELAWNQAVLG